MMITVARFGDYIPKEEGTSWLNERYVFQFPNGYGASVIRSPYSYGGPDGLYELAVLKNGKINYKTPITDDVVGWLTPDEVTELLGQIQALPGKKK